MKLLWIGVQALSSLGEELRITHPSQDKTPPPPCGPKYELGDFHMKSAVKSGRSRQSAAVSSVESVGRWNVPMHR